MAWRAVRFEERRGIEVRFTLCSTGRGLEDHGSQNEQGEYFATFVQTASQVLQHRGTSPRNSLHPHTRSKKICGLLVPGKFTREQLDNQAPVLVRPRPVESLCRVATGLRVPQGLTDTRLWPAPVLDERRHASVLWYRVVRC